MKNRITTLMALAATALILLIAPTEVEARGGGRGGGGRGGGGRGGGSGGRAGGAGGSAYRGGNVMNRTPTMSRASNKPAASKAKQKIQSRPSVAQDRGAIQQRPSASNRTELRNQVNRYAQSNPAQNIDRQALRQTAQNLPAQRSSQIAQNRQLSDRTSQRLQQSRPGYDHWFDRNFFDSHNIDVGYMRTGANWWRPAAWGTLATWGAWNWSTPYYYDYGGYSYPVTTTTTSSNVSPYTTTTIPSQPTQMQSVQGPQTSIAANEEWLPLGVFAVVSDYAFTSDYNAAAQANRFIQLAIKRSGEIAGVLYNSANDAAYDLTGMVDPNNQKAYWTMSNQTDSPIASTGMYNLTEDQTPVNVHFSDGSDQKWVLVRLQQEG